ncbi:hypothetical protein DFR42_10793 [Undibacterium pigrum]|uniref:Uncharacterized protein n=2 Tax=Undibacterium pigrum TaxID=401470 RepID=A0A318JMF9_9BURK|nr:hypothetical protein DFR42_10793 [Undibacterium pigrum]
MGHQTILVIGDNFRHQLGKFQRVDYADPLSEHMTLADIMDEAIEEFETSDWPSKGNLLEWVVRIHGVAILNQDQEPDFRDTHKEGWVRLDDKGNICEIVSRTIPEGFFDYIECSINSWKLKSGAKAYVFDRYDDFPASDGFAGSAQKAAIDFEGMRDLVQHHAACRWDSAAEVRGSMVWKPFSYFWEKYPNQNCSGDPYSDVIKEWQEQTGVEAILCQARKGAFYPDERMPEFEREIWNFFWNDHAHHSIDLLLLSKIEYIRRFDIHKFLKYNLIIKNSVLIEERNQKELFDSLPNESLLTLVYVYS